MCYTLWQEDFVHCIWILKGTGCIWMRHLWWSNIVNQGWESDGSSVCTFLCGLVYMRFLDVLVPTEDFDAFPCYYRLTFKALLQSKLSCNNSQLLWNKFLDQKRFAGFLVFFLKKSGGGLLSAKQKLQTTWTKITWEMWIFLIFYINQSNMYN